MPGSTIVTTAPPELYHSLHPQKQGRRHRYLLRHWRYAEARRLLWQDLTRRLRRLLGAQAAPVQPRAPEPDLTRWLRPGDLALDAGGDELTRLEKALSQWAGEPLPAIAYHSDIRLTARYGYHPVETVWLLEQAGYQVWLLTADGPIARTSTWYMPQPDGGPGPWLLATPPGYDHTRQSP